MSECISVVYWLVSRLDDSPETPSRIWCRIIQSKELAMWVGLGPDWLLVNGKNKLLGYMCN